MLPMVEVTPGPAQPQAFVTDMNRAIEFYRDVLGFELAFAHGDPPFYALVIRDQARINLRHVDERPFAVDTRDEDLLTASIHVDDPSTLFDELCRNRGGGSPAAPRAAMGGDRFRSLRSRRQPPPVQLVAAAFSSTNRSGRSWVLSIDAGAGSISGRLPSTRSMAACSTSRSWSRTSWCCGEPARLCSS